MLAGGIHGFLANMVSSKAPAARKCDLLYCQSKFQAHRRSRLSPNDHDRGSKHKRCDLGKYCGRRSSSNVALKCSPLSAASRCQSWDWYDHSRRAQRPRPRRTKVQLNVGKSFRSKTIVRLIPRFKSGTALRAGSQVRRPFARGRPMIAQPSFS